MRRMTLRILLGLALALGLSGTAFAEPTSGRGVAVRVDLENARLKLDDGKVLQVGPDTTIYDTDADRDITLSEVQALEGVNEVRLRYYGDARGGSIDAKRIEIGSGAGE